MQNGSNETERDEGNGEGKSDLVPEIVQSTRSFAGIPDKYQGITNIVWQVVESCTLYQKPLLIPGKVLQLIHDPWEWAQGKNEPLQTVRKVDAYVSPQDSL